MCGGQIRGAGNPRLNVVKDAGIYGTLETRSYMERNRAYLLTTSR